MNRIDRMELIGWTEELCQRNEVVSAPFQMSEEPQVLKLGLSILIVLFKLGLSKTPDWRAWSHSLQSKHIIAFCCAFPAIQKHSLCPPWWWLAAEPHSLTALQCSCEKKNNPKGRISKALNDESVQIYVQGETETERERGERGRAGPFVQIQQSKQTNWIKAKTRSSCTIGDPFLTCVKTLVFSDITTKTCWFVHVFPCISTFQHRFTDFPCGRIGLKWSHWRNTCKSCKLIAAPAASSLSLSSLAASSAPKCGNKWNSCHVGTTWYNIGRRKQDNVGRLKPVDSVDSSPRSGGTEAWPFSVN